MLQHCVTRAKSLSQPDTSRWPRAKLVQTGQHVPLPFLSTGHTGSSPTTTPSITLQTPKCLQEFTHVSIFDTPPHMPNQVPEFPFLLFPSFGRSCPVQPPQSHPMTLRLTQSSPRSLGCLQSLSHAQGARSNPKIPTADVPCASPTSFTLSQDKGLCCYPQSPHYSDRCNKTLPQQICPGAAPQLKCSDNSSWKFVADKGSGANRM